MQISKKTWENYIKILNKIDHEAGKTLQAYIKQHGLTNEGELITVANAIINQYGNAAAAMNAIFYDSITTAEALYLPAAEIAETATEKEIANSILKVLRISQNPNMVTGTATKFIKQQGQDTMLKNAIRDRAEFAWIPQGDTCPFCITLASRGWQPASKEALNGGHAEHIHKNCDCAYAIRHKKTTTYASYNPDKYLKMYDDAEGKTSADKINYMRRQQYAENKDKINAQKREAYKLRQEAKNGD